MTPLFAAVNWLEISINLLLVIHVIICLLLALVVLMQRPKQEGLGAAFGSGLTDQAFGARTTDVLQKGTVYLGTMFFVVTLVLAILIGKRQNTNPSMVDTSKPDVEKTTPVETAIPAVDDSKAPVVMPEADKAPVEKKDEVKPVEKPKATPAPAPDVTPPAPTPPTEFAKPVEKPVETPETPAEPATGGNQ